MKCVHGTVEEVNEYVKGFDESSYIWSQDKYVYLEQFLTYSRSLNPDEMLALDMPCLYAEVPKIAPTLVQFREKVLLL